jgi:hypothetical protein
VQLALDADRGSGTRVNGILDRRTHAFWRILLKHIEISVIAQLEDLWSGENTDPVGTAQVKINTHLHAIDDPSPCGPAEPERMAQLAPRLILPNVGFQ